MFFTQKVYYLQRYQIISFLPNLGALEAIAKKTEIVCLAGYLFQTKGYTKWGSLAGARFPHVVCNCPWVLLGLFYAVFSCFASNRRELSSFSVVLNTAYHFLFYSCSRTGST